MVRRNLAGQCARLLGVLVLLLPGITWSAEIHLRPGDNIHLALSAAQPGSVLFLTSGIHGPIGSIPGLRGTPEQPIRLIAEPDAVIDADGAMALHLGNAAHVVLENIVIENSFPHGISIDDGGDHATPASGIVLRNVTIRRVGKGGNSDCLKLSGVDDFLITGSRFEGCDQGEGIDMVGCHHGRIESNRFVGMPGTGVQTKGGSSDIIVARNRFSDIGQRGVNLGGHTGEPYFRPLDAKFEAARVTVEANVFERIGDAAVVYSGCDSCLVVNNTIVHEDRAAIAIVQENAERASGRGGIFARNLIVFNTLWIFRKPGMRISADAAGQSHRLIDNVWASQWRQVDPAELPAGTHHLLSPETLFVDPTRGDFHPGPGNPTRGISADPIFLPDSDYDGRAFDSADPEIGAFARARD